MHRETLLHRNKTKKGNGEALLVGIRQCLQSKQRFLQGTTHILFLNKTHRLHEHPVSNSGVHLDAMWKSSWASAELGPVGNGNESMDCQVYGCYRKKFV